MQKLTVAMLLMISSFAHAKDMSIRGEYCGTRGSFLGTLASEVAIPDYFPPEKFLTRLFISPFFPDISVCEEEYEAVHLGESCRAHDDCYTTLGESKDGCDEDLLTRWQESCAERYSGQDETSSHCRDACETFTRLMYDAMRYDDGLFCPSCKAYEIDQEKARNMSLL